MATGDIWTWIEQSDGTLRPVKANGTTAGLVPLIPVTSACMHSSVTASLAKADSAAQPVARSFNNSPGRSLITTAASANGFQISSSRDAYASYSVSITTTATIGVAAAGSIILEICATNSSTAGDWITAATSSISQTVTVAVALSSVQVNAIMVAAMVPSGYYARLRQITTTGTVSFAYIGGQEVLL